jgi:hypothetical protein
MTTIARPVTPCENWTLRFDEFERGNKRFGFTDACYDSYGRNALLKTFGDAFWEDVELQHTAAAMQAWGCVDDTAHHACTALEYVTYEELQQAAAAVQACDGIATRGYATRVRVRHVDIRVRVRGRGRVRVRGRLPCTCTPLEYVTYVELQYAAAAVQAWGYVDDTAHHACTPLAGMPPVRGHPTQGVEHVSHVRLRYDTQHTTRGA